MSNWISPVARGSGSRTLRNASRRRLAFETLEQRRLLAVNVMSTVETVADSGEEDDIAIWIHPTDPTLSRVIGTVKTSSSSLRVYNLQGQQVQSVSVANVNNVDLRYNFSLSGQPVTIVAGSNRSSNSIALYKFDAQNGLQNIAARTITTNLSIYGLGMYVSPTSGKHFVIVSSESGQIQQWELADNGAGKVDAVLVRSFNVGSQAEGIVADDELGLLYISEESGGIWRYNAEPNGGTTRTRVDTTGSGGHLDADVEGLAIYYASTGTGYLIASSQGNNEFAVYRREGNNAYINSFVLVSGNGIDAAADTDGIDVTNFPLNSTFSQGMFVAQDDNDNFKFVKWESIDAAFGGILATDTSWDPRLIGKAPDPNASIGDYNRDSIVDAADYVLWRKSFSATNVPAYSGADGNGDGHIDAADHDVWQQHLGQQVAAGASATQNAVTTDRDYESRVEILAAALKDFQPRRVWAETRRTLAANQANHHHSNWLADTAMLAWFGNESHDIDLEISDLQLFESEDQSTAQSKSVFSERCDDATEAVPELL